MTYTGETLTFKVPTPRALRLNWWSDTEWSSAHPLILHPDGPVFTITILPNGQARLLVQRVRDDAENTVILDRTYFSFGVALLAMQMFEGSPLPVLLPGFKMEPTYD